MIISRLVHIAEPYPKRHDGPIQRDSSILAGRVSWQELQGFVVEALADKAIPQPKAVELRDRVTDFNDLMKEVERHRTAQGAELDTFRDSFCSAVVG